MKKWEYLIVEVAAGGIWGNKIDAQEFNNTLNDLGRDGWEAVSTVDLNRYEGATKGLLVTLKRELMN